jgi:phage shock protein PspC (stress-responsive transcriptional regulator)
MLQVILWGAVACAVVGIIFYIISAKVEPKKGAKVA